ncbi:guided entry of tail-anchored proteins factor 1 [Lucilia cuprina]|uniref:guided entry of tail-anchored proteins factor 1 n=1 Tax=Lucilia cuprina TaxID=7375 RepID=UPI001F05DEBE|nr:guided entry of tail-anchored proteins factor 1 [Lucilia cuprina]
MLFLAILLICFFLTFITDIIKFLKISKLFAPKRDAATAGLQQELRKAREELQNVKNCGPANGEYSLFIKTMRAEQKVKDLEQKIRSERTVGQLKGASAELILNYGIKTVLYITLVIISIRNRYNPVLIFGEQFNFQPLQGLLTFPTGVANAVSVPVWVLSCNVTFRLISGLIKQK